MTNDQFNESVVLAIRAMMRRNEQSKTYQGGIWSDAHCNDFQQGKVLDEACDSQGVHWQQGSDREWKAVGYCCANCLEIDQQITNDNPFI